MKWIIAISCALLGAFSVIGFMATFEPGATGALGFRVLYSVIWLACLAGIVVALTPRQSH